MRHPTNHIFEHSPDSLREWCAANRMPVFRADQILDWVYQKGVVDPGAMLNLSKLDRERLTGGGGAEGGMTFLSGATVAQQRGSDGTQKLLIQWDEDGEGRVGETVRGEGLALPLVGPGAGVAGSGVNGAGLDSSRQTECVMIPAGEISEESGVHERRTACISSQVGCPVGCRFCASGIGGLDGNLSAGRIVEQVWRLGRLPGVGRISNVVFMGMGEPLSNFGPVMKAVRTIAAPWGLGVGARRITISTVGLPAAIERLAEQLELPVTLALSLHAPNDELRRTLIPWAEYTTIPELIGACRKWFEKSGREITLEYILLGGVNDRPEHARELAAVARTLRANVNLIRYNEVKGMPFARPLDEDVLTFQGILREQHVNTHIRASRGRDIAAACGQLRHEKAGAGAAT